MPSLVRQHMLDEIRKEFDANPYAFITSFEKATVADSADFRRALEKVSSRSLVIKQTLAKKVLLDMKCETAEKYLKGSVLVTFGDKDPQNISKAIVDFVKTNKKFGVGGVVFESQVYDSEFVNQLAKLPSRHELLTQVVVRVKSPISGFVMTLSQVLRGLVVVVSEIKKQREAGPAAA